MRYGVPPVSVGRIPLHAKQEIRRHQQPLERELDARLEVPVPPAVAVQTEERLDVPVRDRPAIGATDERAENLLRTALLVLRSRWTAHKNLRDGSGSPSAGRR